MDEPKSVRVEVDALPVEVKKVLEEEVTVNVIHLPSSFITQRNISLKHVYKYSEVAIEQYRSRFDTNAPDEHFYVVVISNTKDVTTFRFQRREAKKESA